MAELLEILSEKDWNDYVLKMENEYHKRYGYGLHFRMQWVNWKIKNYCND